MHNLESDKLLSWRAFSANIAPKSPLIGEFASFLHGVTVGVKDIIDVEGLPTRCGSPIFHDAVPAIKDATAVARLRNAGAVIIGKTVTTELASFVPTATRHPQFPEHSPGGSSVGSAVAVAAGQIDLALGTQTAGSIIRPAAYCGVIGFKPTFGSIPTDGVLVQSPSLDTIGAFARDVDLLRRWFAASSLSPIPDNASEVLSRPLRVRVIQNNLERASPAMRQALSGATAALAAAGHDVASLTLPPALEAVITHQQTIQHAEAARAYAHFRLNHREQITPALLAQLDAGAAIPDDLLKAALADARAARAIADTLLAECDCWLLPAACGTAPLISDNTTGDPYFCRLASVLGVPAINLPAKVGANELPLGLQLLGRCDTDFPFLNTAKTFSESVR
jgi:Asp-tRNA(Asn)/Glu-tRNA(Gln) amidotransferase A subunit family amidase